MKIYHYPKCTTCKRAKKFIEDNNIKVDFVDITEEQPSASDIKKILDEFEIDVKKLFNTSGMKYRELGLKDKLKEMSEKEKIDLLISDGMLIKRPLAFDLKKKILLRGFKEEEWKDAFLNK